jgi:YggT family protein
MGLILSLLLLALEIYTYILIAAVVYSWLVVFGIVNPSNRYVASAARFLYQATEPVLGRIRRYVPAIGGMDLSPLIALLALIVIKSLLRGLL